jgi:hypothetical protein
MMEAYVTGTSVRKGSTTSTAGRPFADRYCQLSLAAGRQIDNGTLTAHA